MNIIEKLFLFIKKIFVKQDETKKIQETKIAVEQDVKGTFFESLKTTTTEKRNKKRVETLTCNGDGLGIQKKITC